MKIAIVSDVHANLPAFKKVLEHINEIGSDMKVCLGDILGYGPSPNECVELTIKEFNYIVMGNHDLAVFSEEEAMSMVPSAREAIEWTKGQITPSNVNLLKELDYGYVIEDEIMFIHGNPSAPFRYTRDQSEALNGFLNPVKPFNTAFIGHTHVPVIWGYSDDRHISYIRPNFDSNFNKESSYVLELKDGYQYIINVGSVGQPRDNDPRACYGIFDTDTKTLTLYRIPYSIDRTIGRMQQLGFSTESWMRLMYGN